MEAMKCDFVNPATGIRDTPLRLLIKMFPDLAKKVFDKCMETNLQRHTDVDGDGKKVQLFVYILGKCQLAFNSFLIDTGQNYFTRRCTV